MADGGADVGKDHESTNKPMKIKISENFNFLVIFYKHSKSYIYLCVYICTILKFEDLELSQIRFEQHIHNDAIQEKNDKTVHLKVFRIYNIGSMGCQGGSAG